MINNAYVHPEDRLYIHQNARSTPASRAELVARLRERPPVDRGRVRACPPLLADGPDCAFQIINHRLTVLGEFLGGLIKKSVFPPYTGRNARLKRSIAAAQRTDLRAPRKSRSSRTAQRLEIETQSDIEAQDGREIDKAEEAEGRGSHRLCHRQPQHVLHREHGNRQHLDDLQALPERRMQVGQRVDREGDERQNDQGLDAESKCPLGR